ncbi:GNAT family N-acetyltransferase [Leptolyngbya sp. AN02str]|uniref:GNAT family N-acetyltransferase n=1 Tax=Leptolyngbya sp. AN02str TaxID=3423363 RepID=UPI003D31D3E4
MTEQIHVARHYRPVVPSESELSYPTLSQPYPLIRTLRPGDVDAIADILASSFHPQAGLGGWLYPLLRLGIREDLKSRLNQRASTYVCLVALQRAEATLDSSPSAAATEPSTDGMQRVDQPVGTVEMTLRSPTTPIWQTFGRRYPYVSNLAVAQAGRRKGVAERLLRSSEQVALSWGYRDVYLHVLENNEPARSLYTKLGYETVRVEPDFISGLLGQPRQILLHKPLVNPQSA